MTELETMLLNWLPVGTVTEEDAASRIRRQIPPKGVFLCGVLTHMTDQCQTLDESFPFLPMGWQAERIRDQFILRPDPSIFAIELETLARRVCIDIDTFSYRWCGTDSSMDRRSVHSADIWTVWDRILPWPTKSTVVVCGKVTLKWKLSHGRARTDALRVRSVR